MFYRFACSKCSTWTLRTSRTIRAEPWTLKPDPCSKGKSPLIRRRGGSNSADLSDTLSIAKKKFGYATEGILSPIYNGRWLSFRKVYCLACEVRAFRRLSFCFGFQVTNLRFVFVLKTVEKRFFRWWKSSLDLSIAKQYSRSWYCGSSETYLDFCYNLYGRFKGTTKWSNRVILIFPNLTVNHFKLV